MATVAFIIADLVEDSELEQPRAKLRDAGHDVLVVGVQRGTVRGKRGGVFTAAWSVDEIRAGELDALVIPGGYSPDKLRLHPGMVALTRDMVRSGRTVAAICHGPWMLIEADVVRDRQVTSHPAVRTDLVNAGARWTDAGVVEDGNLITSREPGDLEAFGDTLVQQLGRVPAHHW